MIESAPSIIRDAENSNYVLITPARNEATYIEMAIQSVVAQTILPRKWVIVSDASTDGTDEIVREYLAKYDFIELVAVERAGKRNFGEQVNAFNRGLERIKGMRYEYLGNLDADVSFGPDYYKSILEKFRQSPALGIAGGFIYEKDKGEFKSLPMNTSRSVANAVQLFRRECFEGVGGYVPLKYGGHDWLVEVMARMNGWTVESFPGIEVFHHRPTSTADGILKGALQHGLMDHSLGSHPLFELLKCLRRVKSKPYALYAFLRMTGFVWGYFRREKRMVTQELVQYLRREQMQRLRWSSQ
jgi:glycosyltransferase involved in cell wall biosynthesis